MKIVVGLGNPGDKYVNSRHNAGWIFLDNLISNPDFKENKKFKALLHKEADTLYVKPLTFMNNSGESIRKIMDFYGLLPRSLGIITKKNQDLSNILTVIHDELDLDFGKEKISQNAGSAGHKGVASIINHLKTKNFTRLRIGIKNEFLKNKIPAENFVLQNFSKEELVDLTYKANHFEQKQIF